MNGKQYIAVTTGWGTYVSQNLASLYGEPFKVCRWTVVPSTLRAAIAEPLEKTRNRRTMDRRVRMSKERTRASNTEKLDHLREKISLSGITRHEKPWTNRG